MIRTRSTPHRARSGRPLANEIRTLLRRSVSPPRIPTSRELGDRLPAVARVLGEQGTRAGLRDAEVRSLLEMYVSRLLELRLRERLAEAVGPVPAGADTAPPGAL